MSRLILITCEKKTIWGIRIDTLIYNAFDTRKSLIYPGHCSFCSSSLNRGFQRPLTTPEGAQNGSDLHIAVTAGNGWILVASR